MTNCNDSEEKRSIKANGYTISGLYTVIELPSDYHQDYAYSPIPSFYFLKIGITIIFCLLVYFVPHSYAGDESHIDSQWVMTITNNKLFIHYTSDDSEMRIALPMFSLRDFNMIQMKSDCLEIKFAKNTIAYIIIVRKDACANIEQEANNYKGYYESNENTHFLTYANGFEYGYADNEYGTSKQVFRVKNQSIRLEVRGKIELADAKDLAREIRDNILSLNNH